MGRSKSPYSFLHYIFVNTVKKASFSLQNIDFEATPGDLICVIGPVGSGKVNMTTNHYTRMFLTLFEEFFIANTHRRNKLF